MLHMRPEVIFQEKAVETLERPLDGERLLQEDGTVLLFLNSLDESIELTLKDLCPMEGTTFYFLIYGMMHMFY